MKIFIILIGTIVSAILYRCGGMSKDDTAKPEWIPKWARQRLVRRWGCPLVSLLVLFLIGIQPAWWVYPVVFLLAWLMTTTYWDEVFGYDNFYAHGFMIGLAYLPYMVAVTWWILILRALVLGLFMGIWCRIFENDVVEEMGRGAAIVATLILLLFVSGCASTLNAKYDSEGRLIGLNASGQQESSVKQDADGTVEYKMNNKQEPLIKDVISINALKDN